MAVKIKFDASHNAEQPTFVLTNRSGKKIGRIPVSNLQFKDSFDSASEARFDVYKSAVEEIRVWTLLKDFKLAWAREWNALFELKVDIGDKDSVCKSVVATSLGEAELSQVNLYNMEINTETDIDRDDYVATVLYNETNPKASLLHRILDKAPHYSIGHVDASIANIQRSFSFDDKSIYDALLDIGKEVQCYFKIECYFGNNGNIVRKISAYDLETFCLDCNKRGEFRDRCEYCGSENVIPGYGEDTTIFISKDNLTDEVKFTTDTDAVKNCFRIEAGDELMTAAITSCNPNGSPYIWYISDDLKEDMSEELAARLNAYDVLYDYYNTEYEVSIPANLKNAYNALISKYSIYSNQYKALISPIVGFANLIQIYYDTIDFYLFLHDTLMPSVEISNTTAEEEAKKLTDYSLSPVAVQNLQTVSVTTASNAVMQMAKTIVDSRYQVKVKDATIRTGFSGWVDGLWVETGDSIIWTGKFILTNYSDEDDTATTENIMVTLSDDYEQFVGQKIKKILSNQSDEATDVVSLFSLDETAFAAELKKYSLVCLNNFNSCGQSCIDMLIEQGIADSESWEATEQNLYNSIYAPYYLKLTLIQEEIQLRESEIAIIQGTFDSNGSVLTDGVQTIIESQRREIQSALNFENYIGEDLWFEFVTYRREDTYENQNYISDGLDNAQLFEYAIEFLDVARKDIYKSANLQHSITSTLKNLLVIKEFEPIVDYFEIGNWLRIKVDETVYKLRLIEYTIDYDNLSSLEVTFSDVEELTDGRTKINELLESAKSMSTSYGSVSRQAGQGKKSYDRIEKWVNKSLDLTNMKIVGNADNQNVSWDEHGFLCREYSDITDSYDSKQLKIINRGLYVTDDNWRTSSAGIGNFMYYDPTDGQMKEDYGVIAKVLVGNLILSERVGIYNQNNSITMDENGLKILTETQENDTRGNALTITRHGLDRYGNDTYEDLFYIDNNGQLVLNGLIHVSSKGSVGTLGDLTDEKRWLDVIEQKSNDTDAKFDAVWTELETKQNQVNIRITALENYTPEPQDYIITSTNYVFDRDGLSIRKTNNEIGNYINETGMYVRRYYDGTNYDEILTVNNVGVDAINVSARQYLIIGDNCRFENYGTNRTACFYYKRVS